MPNITEVKKSINLRERKKYNSQIQKKNKKPYINYNVLILKNNL